MTRANVFLIWFLSKPAATGGTTEFSKRGTMNLNLRSHLCALGLRTARGALRRRRLDGMSWAVVRGGRRRTVPAVESGVLQHLRAELQFTAALIGGLGKAEALRQAA